jgi:hypothetical protein
MDPLDLLVCVREDGTLEPIGRAAAARLEAGPTRFRLLPGPRDVLVLRAISSEDEVPRAILLAGELRHEGALAEAVTTIAHAGWSGELVVCDDRSERSLFVREGVVVGARSTAAPERIGAVVIRLGVLAPAAVEEIVAHLGEGKRFGEIAVERGLVTRERLFEVVRRQALAILEGALAVSSGAFVFVEGIDPTRIPARCQIDALDAVARVLPRVSRAELPDLASIEAPVAAFNGAISSIYDAVAVHGKMGLLRATLDAFAAESPVDRAVFAQGRVAPDGTIDPRGVAEVLVGLGIEQPAQALRTRLHEYLTYAVFVATSALDPSEERALLSSIEGAIVALTPRPPSARPRVSSVPPPLPSAKEVHRQVIGRVALKKIPSRVGHAAVEESELQRDRADERDDRGGRVDGSSSLVEAATPSVLVAIASPHRPLSAAPPPASPSAVRATPDVPKESSADSKRSVRPPPLPKSSPPSQPTPPPSSQAVASPSARSLPAITTTPERSRPVSDGSLPNAEVGASSDRRGHGVPLLVAAAAILVGLGALVVVSIMRAPKAVGDVTAAVEPVSSAPSSPSLPLPTSASTAHVDRPIDPPRDPSADPASPQADAIAAPATSGSATTATEPPATSGSATTATEPATTGTIKVDGPRGHRVWIDGRLVGDTPFEAEIACGDHVVKVGSVGSPQMTEVPCGGKAEVGLR